MLNCVWNIGGREPDAVAFEGARDAGKVTEKVDKLTVFGGLEGVLEDVVRIQVPAT
jgi:hypothetical protein